MLTAKECNAAFATLPELSTIGITGVHTLTIHKMRAMVIQTPKGTAVILDAKARYISEDTKAFDALKTIRKMDYIHLINMGFVIHLG